jgi:hypothetical protein
MLCPPLVRTMPDAVAGGREAKIAPRCTSARCTAPRAATKMVGRAFPSGTKVKTGPYFRAMKRSMGSMLKSRRARKRSGPTTGMGVGPGGRGGRDSSVAWTLLELSALARSRSEQRRQSSVVRVEEPVIHGQWWLCGCDCA